MRDRLLAAQFGAGIELDIYNSAFVVPDFIMNLLAAALTTAFIPVFTEVRQRSGQTAAWEITGVLLSCLTVVMIMAAGLAALTMPWLTQAVAPGFTADEQQQLVQASRLMLLSPVFFALSIAVGAALQGNQRFMSYALSPVLYNFGIIAGIIWFAPRWGVPGVVVGVIAGALLHLLIRYFELRVAGWRWRWQLAWRNLPCG